MGIELGQESEWAEARELDWWLLEHSEHRGVHDLMRDLNRAYVDSPAIWSRDDEAASFAWINANDAGRNVFSFVRHGTKDSADLVCVANFAATPHGDYRLGLPSAGRWDEVLNTDAAGYAGSGVGNLGTIEAVAGEQDGQPAYATVVLPPLATVWFRKQTAG